MFERELCQHLEEVKGLELKLAEEKRRREQALLTADSTLVQYKEELKVKEDNYAELMDKLSTVYQEVSVVLLC